MVNDSLAERPLQAGELARRTGVSKDALRFYERQGLLPLPERLQNNYRVYPPGTVERVLWIRKVLGAGFTVEELSRILAERECGGVPCRKVRDLGAAKLVEMEERLLELESARDALKSLLRDWDRRLAEVGPGELAGLLESLPENARQKKRKLKETR